MIRRAYNMFTKAEEIYSKFNEENIQIMIPKKIIIYFITAGR